MSEKERMFEADRELATQVLKNINSKIPVIKTAVYAARGNILESNLKSSSTRDYWDDNYLNPVSDLFDVFASLENLQAEVDGKRLKDNPLYQKTKKLAEKSLNGTLLVDKYSYKAAEIFSGEFFREYQRLERLLMKKLKLTEQEIDYNFPMTEYNERISRIIGAGTGVRTESEKPPASEQTQKSPAGGPTQKFQESAPTQKLVESPELQPGVAINFSPKKLLAELESSKENLPNKWRPLKSHLYVVLNLAPLAIKDVGDELLEPLGELKRTADTYDSGLVEEDSYLNEKQQEQLSKILERAISIYKTRLGLEQEIKERVSQRDTSQ